MLECLNEGLEGLGGLEGLESILELELGARTSILTDDNLAASIP